MPDRPGATTAIDIEASPSKVMDWLLHARAFPLWVIGPARVVQVDDEWPAPGSGFTHETGRGPLRYHDRTTVEDLSEDTGRVALKAYVRPVGLALIQLHVTASGSASRVVMHERPLDGPALWLPSAAYLPALHVRNRRALARLQRLVENAPGD